MMPIFIAAAETADEPEALLLLIERDRSQIIYRAHHTLDRSDWADRPRAVMVDI